MKSALILQPGPAALTDGIACLARILGAPACGERLDGGVGGVMRLSS